VHTLTKLSASLIGHLKPNRVKERSEASLELPPARRAGSALMGLLEQRQSSRDFAPKALPLQLLSDLLWAAFGINRPETGGRTAPSAMNAQEIDIYAALPGGLYIFEAPTHRLHRVAEVDARRVTGYQDFMDEAPLDLIYVADMAHTRKVPITEQEVYAAASAGAIAQNVYLFCAEQGLATVVRGWFDRKALAEALKLSPHEQVLLTQTVGYPSSK
jgi:SagB-type dehydrogenase family enzyme